MTFEYINCFLPEHSAGDFARAMTEHDRLVTLNGDSHLRSLFNAVTRTLGIGRDVCRRGWTPLYMSCYAVLEAEAEPLSARTAASKDPVLAALAPLAAVAHGEHFRVTALSADTNVTISRMLEGRRRIRYVWNPSGEIADIWGGLPSSCAASVATAPAPPAVNACTTAAALAKEQCPAGRVADVTCFNIGQHFLSGATSVYEALQRLAPSLACVGEVVDPSPALRSAPPASAGRRAPVLLWFDTQYTSLLLLGSRYSGDSRTASRTDMYNAGARQLLSASNHSWLIVPSNLYLEAVSDVTIDGAHYPHGLLRPLVDLVMAVLCGLAE